MPTGGVTATKENLSGWFAGGATCVGMGSKLFTKEIVGGRNTKQLENKVRDTLALIKELRS